MIQGKRISKDLSENIKKYEKLKNDNSDLVLRKINILNQYEGIILYIDSICDKNIINRDILNPMLLNQQYEKQLKDEDIIKTISEKLVATGKIEQIYDNDKIIEDLLAGFIILLIDGYDIALSMEVIGGSSRALESPKIGSSLFCSADAFTENIQTNITLIRRKLRDEKLKVQSVKIGEENKRMVSLIYMENETTKEYKELIEKKIKKLPDNKLINLNDISNFLENKKVSLFPIGQYVERPDRVSAQLQQNKIAIICDESPGVLIYPSKFIDFFIMSDDYYNSSIFRYLIYALRILCFWISIILPGLYIAIISFNPEILTVGLSTSIAKSISMVPFPTIYEVFLIMFFVTIIKEASMNLPTKLGSMVGIVGGIILGQSLISSNIVSAPVVILVTFSTIAQLVVPNYKLISTAQILSIFITILSSIFGLIGLVAGLFIIMIHLYSIEDLGLNYMDLNNKN